MRTWLFDFERRILWRRRRHRLIVVLLLFLLVLLLDAVLFRALIVAPLPDRQTVPDGAPLVEHAAHLEMLANFETAKNRLEEKDFYWTLRVAGTLWPWLLVCAALLAHALAARPRIRGLAGAPVMIFLSAALSGGLAELLQILTGRLRPSAADPRGTHQFRGFVERFQNTTDLAFPSSHAAVAFGAAFMVVFVYPRAGAVAMVAAVGCGLTRMAAGAHFASDILGAAILGYCVARLLRPGGWRGPRPAPLLP